jgi:hypothetical protein
MFKKSFGSILRQGNLKANSLGQYEYIIIFKKDTVFTRVICALFSSLAAEKWGCVKYADFLCGGLDVGFILV